MKKRKKKIRPIKDTQSHNDNHLLSDHQHFPVVEVESEKDGISKPMALSDIRVDDESTMEGYDTEGYRQLQSSNESNLNDRDVIDTTDDKRSSTDRCMPLGSNDKTIKTRKETRNKQKPKSGEQIKSRKRGRPPKIRISGLEKLDESVNVLDREIGAKQGKKQCLGWSSEEQGGILLTPETNTYGDWNAPLNQMVSETSTAGDCNSSQKEFGLHHRLPGHTLSENFGPFQIKQTSFVQCTTKDKENNLTRIDDNAGNIIEIVCGPNRGLMYLSRLSLATGERCKTKCIHFNDRWWTPSEFQMTSGRGAAKDWKRTIRHGDKCLKALLESGTLKLNLCNKNACFCELCFRGSRSAKDDSTKMSSSTSHPVKMKESVDKEFSGLPEVEKKTKKRNKDCKVSKQKKSTSEAKITSQHMKDYHLKEFSSYPEVFNNQGMETNGAPPLHLLRNDVPPSLVSLFCRPTNRINDSPAGEGDSFQVFKDAFYSQQPGLQYKSQAYFESNKICDLSFKQDDRDISRLDEIYSNSLRQPATATSTTCDQVINNNKFWKGEEEVKTSDSPKTMLRAVVEELKKKKKKSMTSHNGEYRMAGLKIQDLEDSVMDLSMHESHFPPKHTTIPSVIPSEFKKSPPRSSSPKFSSLASQAHMYSSLFHQTYPHFNFPFYSPYIFMGFPLHPIMSHPLSKDGFQTPFPINAHSFPHEFGKLSSFNQLLTKTKDLTQNNSTNEEIFPRISFPPYSQNDEENLKVGDKLFDTKFENSSLTSHLENSGLTFNKRNDSYAFKSQEENKKEENTKQESTEAAVNSSALDFSFKSWRDSDIKNSNLQALDLSRKSSGPGICL